MNKAKDLNKKTRSRIYKKTIKERIFCYSFLAYPMILFLIFYIYVNLNSFVLAFQNINLDGSKAFVGFEHFANFINGLLSDEGLLKISFKNSIIMHFVGILVSLPLQILFSYMLFKKCFGNKVIRVLVMLPSIISVFVYCMVFRNFAGAELQSAMKLWGFENFPNLIDDSRYTFGTTLFYGVWISFSTSLIIYPNAMRSIDTGIYESAQMDGVITLWQELKHIILPLIYPTISTFLILGFSAIMSDSGSLIAFFMYSAPATTYNMGYYMTVQIFNENNPMNYPGVSAAGMILTLIIAPLTLLLRRFLNKIDPNGEGEGSWK